MDLNEFYEKLAKTTTNPNPLKWISELGCIRSIVVIGETKFYHCPISAVIDKRDCYCSPVSSAVNILHMDRDLAALIIRAADNNTKTLEGMAIRTKMLEILGLS